MAQAQGVSPATVQRIWDAHGLQPHRTRTFKLSKDQRFVEKLTDVVGLYLNPPDKALVLCVDEKTQIQAVDWTQPGLPMKKGRCGTFTHDDKRHGTTTLFAALNVLEGTVIGECMARHRHQEFLKFLRKIDRETPRELDLHLMVDNYSAHKHDRVQSWLAKHRRFHLHYPPISSSWLNLSDRWFRELSQKCIRRGSFASVEDLKRAIQEYLEENNKQPRPFVWTASVEKILAKVNHCEGIFRDIPLGCSGPGRLHGEIADSSRRLFPGNPGQRRMVGIGFTRPWSPSHWNTGCRAPPLGLVAPADPPHATEK